MVVRQLEQMFRPPLRSEDQFFFFFMDWELAFFLLWIGGWRFFFFSGLGDVVFLLDWGLAFSFSSFFAGLRLFRFSSRFLQTPQVLSRQSFYQNGDTPIAHSGLTLALFN